MIDGFKLHPAFLDADTRRTIVEAIRQCLAAAPLYRPVLPRSGKPFSARMSNAGPLGWVSDRDGYRYQATHPATGTPWPAIPDPVLAVWRAVSDYDAPPEACLINWYDPDARMGLHQDRDESAMDAPVVSISLGDTAVFRIGAAEKGSPTRSLRLSSGDVVVLGGAARMARHGIDRIVPRTSGLFDVPGRLNLTLRRVTHPA